ncbi:SDR family NAD(P)-dependent oxidoreductase [Luteolibacter algae]|uniref:SDR family NAD(P)-dependent oxidoreductase n=1 Tax=Luteolibacter algae TaxID=454151 RepID=A0ABW5DB83_9BACT
MKPSDKMIELFEGATVVLTGAASGIGRALATLLYQCGATIHAFDINQNGLDELVGSLSGKNGKIHPRCVSVSDLAEYSLAVDEVYKISPKVDFLFNNAGVTLLGEAQNLPFERWKWLLDINLMGVVNGTHLIYPKMIAEGSGHIINTASIAGSTGYATAAAYTASKGAVLEFSRSLRAEACNHGIRISVACPGYVNSSIFSQDRIVGADRESMIKDLPVRMLTPEMAAWGFLDGVVKNKEKIIFPFTAKFLWTLSCWTPSLLGIFHRRFMRIFQRH